MSKMLCVQIQPNRVSELDKGRIITISKDIACNESLVSHFEIQKNEDDEEAYLHLLYETNALNQLWKLIQDNLIKDSSLELPLSQATIVVCEGEQGWDDYLLLYHFDKTEQLDELN